MPQAIPSLKLIVVDPTNPRVLTNLRRDLEREAGATEVRATYENAYIVNTTLEPSDLRDIIAKDLHEGDSFLVVEFERWSGFGPGIDGVWLMRRGH